ncbi:MAG: beta-lactamase [Gemmatimonadetes bacterium]|nr:beta-lactamase [Gemmatimonadota bacterium]
MLLPALFFVAASLGVPAVPAAMPAETVAVGRPMRGAADPGSRPSRHALVSAAAAGMSMVPLVEAEQQVAAEVDRGAFPGAALAVGRGPRVVLEEGIGRMGWDGEDAVDPDWTLYDLASLSKVVGTTTAAMLLVEDGKLSLDDLVTDYLPEFTGGGRERVTVRMLLTHTAGLPEGADVGGPSADDALARALQVPLEYEPGTRTLYSDLSMVVLFAVDERAAGEPVYRLLDRRVFGPLGMRSTTYVPGDPCERCAATIRGNPGYRGKVHDPIARGLGGFSGNAGLFSTAHDLARYAAMLAGGGTFEGVQVLRAATIRDFTRRQPGAGTRALGWDTPTGGENGAAGARMSPNAFGHTGFTGTSLWVDPERGTWVVLLANRTYDPHGANRIQALRRSVHDLVARSTDEARYTVAGGS